MDPATPTAAAAEPDLSGRSLGDFHILRLLGKGGMGRVYLAEQRSLKRKVALKILKPELAANATALKRFQAEAEAVARLTHGNIVQVYAIGESEGLYYMALEYVDGRNLRDFLSRRGSPELRQGLSIMRQAAAALQRASELGIVHRDIKPENILLTRKGEVKVTDFGLSRCFAPDQKPVSLTQSGITMGTPLYMSPEQVQGQEVDPRSDIYSLGVSCYHMFAGQPPFRGNTAFEVAVQHVQKDPPPLHEVRPDLPPELIAIIHKMMAKDPKARYQTGRELLLDLGRLRENLGGPSSPGGGSEGSLPVLTPAAGSAALSASSVVPVPPRRVGKRVVLVLAVIGALASGTLLRWWQERPSQPTAAPPENVAAVPPSEEEKRLLDAIQQTVNPPEPARVKRGLESRIELGLLYLEQNRLIEAERLFTELENQAPGVKMYAVLGQLGLAITRSFQKRVAESNNLFQELVKEKVLVERLMQDRNPEDRKPGPGPGRWFFNNHPQLRKMIAQSVEQNYRADPQSFPTELDPLRRIPVAPAGSGQRPKNTEAKRISR